MRRAPMRRCSKNQRVRRRRRLLLAHKTSQVSLETWTSWARPLRRPGTSRTWRTVTTAMMVTMVIITIDITTTTIMMVTTAAMMAMTPECAF